MSAARRIQIITLLIALGAAALPACSGDSAPPAAAFPDSLTDDELVATVNTQEITGRDLKVFALVYQPNVADSLTNRLFNLELLNGYIDRLILHQEATAGGITVSDSTHAWFVNRFVETMGGPDRVDEYLSSVDITRPELERVVRRDLAVRSFIEDRLGSGIDITEADARAFYDANPDRFGTGESVHARHIVLRGAATDSAHARTEKLARIEAILARARGGEDFEALARETSEGPSAPQGGDLGYFERAEMVKPFSDAAFALSPGEISDVVETQFGFHIIKVEARRQAEKTSFEDIREQLLDGLYQRELGAQLENHLKRNRSVAIIEPNFDFGGLTQRESATFTR